MHSRLLPSAQADPEDPSSRPEVPPPAGGGRHVPSRERVIGDGVRWTAQWTLRWVVIAVGLVLLGLVLKYAWVIVFPVLMALVLCAVLAPVSTFLRVRARLPNAVAAAVTMVAAIGLVVGVGFTLAPAVASQSDNLVSGAVAGLQRVLDWVQDSDVVSSEQVDAGLQELQQRLSGSAGIIASGLLSGVAVIGNGLINLVLVLVLGFLFLKDGHRFLPWLSRLGGPTAGRHLRTVADRAWQTLGGFIRTQALVSFIDAVLIGAGLLVIGVPLALPLAVLTFVAGFVPIVGAFVAGAAAVLVALVSNGPAGALLVLVLIVVVQQVEGNVLSPVLQSRSMDLHAAVVLLAITLGGTLFGITGAFFAVPVAAVLAVVLRYLDEVVDRRTTPDDPGQPGEAGPATYVPELVAES